MTIILYVCIIVNLFSCYLNYQARKQLLQRLTEAKRLIDCLKQIDQLEKQEQLNTNLRAGMASDN